MPDTSGSVDLAPKPVDPSTLPESGPTPAMEVLTAFTVVMHTNGQVELYDYTGDDYIPLNPVNNDIVVAVGAILQKDASARETAQLTIGLQMQQMQQAIQQQEAARLSQSLGDLRG